MMNIVTLMGRLVRDPELRRTGSGKAVAGFTLAVDRDFADKQSGEKETDFIDCVAWGGTCEFVAKHFTKGKMLALSGRLQKREWTDKEGNKRHSYEVVANSVWFCGSREAQSGGNSQSVGNDAHGGNAPQSSTGGFPETEEMLRKLNAGGFDYPMLEDDDAQLPF